MDWLIILVITLIASVNAKRPHCTFDPFCYYYTNGCELSGCSPYRVERNVSCDDCLQLCEQEQTIYDDYGNQKLYCKSLVYDCETQTCKIYCDDDSGNGKLVLNSKSIYLRYINENCPYTTPQSVTTSVSPIGGFCPAGTVGKIIKIDGYQSNEIQPDQTGHTQMSTDVFTCETDCLNNQLPDGTQYDCHSAEFLGDKCTFSTVNVNPQNSDTLMKVEGGTLFQKMCFNANLVSNCQDFEAVPQKALIGINKQTIDSTSFQDCINHCLTAQTDAGFVCQSGLYFSESTSQNCLLNVETKDTRPDLWTDYHDAKVIYFAPHCSGGIGGGGGNGGGSSSSFPTFATGGFPSAVTTMATTFGSQTFGFPSANPVSTGFGSSQGNFQFTTAGGIASSRSSRFHRRRTTTGSFFDIPEGSNGNTVTARPVIAGTHTRPVDNSILVDSNRRHADEPLKKDSTCRAYVRNGIKNCKIGVRMVGGVTRYCSRPVDCL